MAYYLAVKTSAKRPATASFLSRGINEFTAAQIRDLEPKGIKTMIQLAYPHYQENISAFLFATEQGKTVGALTLPCPLSFEPLELPNLAFPQCYFIPKFSINEDQADGLAKTIPASGAEIVPKKKGAILKLTTPKIEDCLKLARAAENTSGHIGEPSVIDIVTASKILHIINLFLRTQTYSAQKEEEYTEEDEKKKRWIGGEYEHAEERIPADVPCAGFRAAKEQYSAWQADRNQSNWSTFDATMSMKGNDATRVHLTSRDWVYKAKPSPYPSGFNTGGIAEVPEGEGIVFPYFDRQIIPSRSHLGLLFKDCGFIRLLGATVEEYLDGWKSFRLDLMSLSDTEYGCMLGHMLTGVKLALEAQSRLFVVLEEGQYLGFVLLGKQTCVEIGGVTVRAKPSSEVASALDKMQTHAGAIKELCTILSGADLIGTTIQEEVADIPGSSYLYQQLTRRKMDKGTMSKVHGLYRGLRFKETYLSATAKHICEGLVALSKGETYLPNSPRFIPDNHGALADPLLNFLALFGPEAPSPINAKGKSYNIPKVKEREYSAPADDVRDMEKRQEFQNKYQVEERQRLECGILTMKPILVALADWKTALKERQIKMNPAERAKVHRNLVFTGAQTRAFEIALGLWAGAKVSGKRKADEEPSGRKKKASTTAATSFEELIGLFGAPVPALPPRAPSPPTPSTPRAGSPATKPLPPSVPPTPSSAFSPIPSKQSKTITSIEDLSDSERLSLARAKVPAGTWVTKRLGSADKSEFTRYWWELVHPGGSTTTYDDWNTYREEAIKAGVDLGPGTDTERKFRLVKSSHFRI